VFVLGVGFSESGGSEMTGISKSTLIRAKKKKDLDK